MPSPTPLPADLLQVKEMLQTTLDAQRGLPNGFDLDQWLHDWLQRPHPALGGTCPMEIFNTQDGIEAICGVLGAVMSGAYQ